MSLNTNIKDTTKGKKTSVTAAGEVLISKNAQPVPEAGVQNFQQYLKADLTTSGGSSSMRVDGSVTPVEFTLEASDDYDIYIQQINIIIVDSAVAPKWFGFLTPLTIGWDLVLTEGGDDFVIVDKAKTGGEITRESGFGLPFGFGTSVFAIAGWVDVSDAYVITLKCSDFLPEGLRIGRGTQDKITATVNDDVLLLTEMTTTVFGYKSIPR